MLESFKSLFKKKDKEEVEDVEVSSKSKEAAKERLHLVLMQDRANVSVDFLDMMKQEIIDVIKKYIDVDENEMDVRLTNKINKDGTNGAPALYANIPIIGIKTDTSVKKVAGMKISEINNLKKNEVQNKDENKIESDKNGKITKKVEKITEKSETIIKENPKNKENNVKAKVASEKVKVKQNPDKKVESKTENAKKKSTVKKSIEKEEPSAKKSSTSKNTTVKTTKKVTSKK